MAKNVVTHASKACLFPGRFEFTSVNMELTKARSALIVNHLADGQDTPNAMGIASEPHDHMHRRGKQSPDSIGATLQASKCLEVLERAPDRGAAQAHDAAGASGREQEKRGARLGSADTVDDDSIRTQPRAVRQECHQWDM